MLRAFWFAGWEVFARKHHNWPGGYHLLRWAIHRQLIRVQEIGDRVDAVGPFHIENQGWIETGTGTILRSSWHHPISISVVRPGARLLIGENVFINWVVNIGVTQEITIGEQTEIGDDCILYDSDWHSSDGTVTNPASQPTHIGRGVWLGARVVVLKGIEIGDNTIVAANSTVTKSLPSNVLAAGNPAHVVHPIERHEYQGVIKNQDTANDFRQNLL